MSEPSPRICPLCQQPNACAVATGDKISNCWCASSGISANAIAAIGSRDRGKRCLCQRCGQAVEQELVIER